MIAWNCDDETLIRIKTFNIVTYLVRIPRVVVEPTSYWQNTRDGSRAVRPTVIPQLVVEERMATLGGYRAAFAERVDAVTAIGYYKSEIAEMLKVGTREPAYRMAIGDQARRDFLHNLLRQRIKLEDGQVKGWMIRDIFSFDGRRIAELSRVLPAV